MSRAHLSAPSLLTVQRCKRCLSRLPPGTQNSQDLPQVSCALDTMEGDLKISNYYAWIAT